MEKIWHDRFVEESNLTFNIKMLRKALGDDASDPKFIENVPRRGYRFIAEVREISSESTLQTDVKPKFTKMFWAGVPLLIGFVALIAFASWFWKKNSNELNAPILSAGFNSIKLTDTGKVNHAAISPDGKYVVYTNEVNGKESLWLRRLETGNNSEILPVTDERYYGVTFSNNSENIFFTRRPNDLETPMSIYKIPLLGGVPTKITDKTQGVIKVTPDDKQVIFVRYENRVGSKNSLMIVDIEGKTERIIKTTEEVGNVFWGFNISPDGKKIVAGYGHTDNASKNMKLVEVDVATGQMRQLSGQMFFGIQTFSYLPDQSGFIFTAGETLGDNVKIWTYNFADQKIKLITNDSTHYSQISLNQNADRLLATVITFDFGLYLGNPDNPNNPKRLTQARDGVTFTPDGKIVYASDTSGNEDIWIMNDDGSNQRQLTTDKGLDAYPGVSPDNRFIYFASNRSGEFQIWRMNLDGSNQIQLTKNSGGRVRFVTPDGKWIYYERNVDKLICKVSMDGAEESPLFAKPKGLFQAFSADGEQMAFLGIEEITIISVATEQIIKKFPIPKGRKIPFNLYWTADGKSLTFSVDDGSGANFLWEQPLEGGSPKKLFPLGKEKVMDCLFSNDKKNYVLIKGIWKHDAVLLKGLK
jgi:Tol biopolymer transport system component